MSLINDPAATIREKAKQLWEHYGRDFLQTHPINGWEQNRWQQAAVNDLTYQYNRVSKLHILGQGQGATLKKLYTQVYLLPERDAFERYGEDVNRPGMWVGRMTVRVGKRQNGLALAAALNRLYILGQPGAGKTTFLKRLTLEAITGEIAQWPMFVPLVEVAQAKQTIAGFMAAQLAEAGFNDAESFTRYLFHVGGWLLLLDGLDEVPDEQNHWQIIREIEQLSNRFPQVKLLLTCRTAAARYQFTGLQYAEIAEFNELQVQTFVHNWFGPGGEETATACYWELRQTETFKEMARVPLLLTLLCAAYEPEKGFPRKRAEIYHVSIEGLLQKWDEMRGVERPTIAALRPNQVFEMLAYVAYQTFLEGHQLMAGPEIIRRLESYCQRNFNQRVDGQEWLKQVQANTGLLVERSHSVFAFAHLTLHEYFAAWWIIEKESWDKFQSYITDPRWREVMLLMAELPTDATVYLTLFLEELQAMVASDKALVDLLQWEAVKSAQAYATAAGLPSAGRAFYIFIDLVLDLGSDLARACNLIRELGPKLTPIFPPDLLYALDFVGELNSELNRTRPSGLDRAYPVARALDLDRKLARARELARALSSYPRLALDFMLGMFLLVSQILVVDKIKAINERVTAELGETAKQLDHFCCDANLPDLQAALVALHLPDKKARRQELKAFAIQLTEIARTHRGLGHEWNLSKEQATLLEKYLQTNLFFVECLNLATVPDRAAIESQILLPPGTS